MGEVNKYGFRCGVSTLGYPIKKYQIRPLRDLMNDGPDYTALPKLRDVNLT